MMEKEELQATYGGGVSWLVIGGVIAGVISFLGGFLDGITRPLKCNKQKGRKNMKLNSEELLQIEGGSSITASMVSAIVDGFQKIFELGRAFGSAISHFVKRNFC